MTIRTIAEHNTRCDKPGDRTRVAKCERQVVEILLAQSFDLLALECRTANDVGQNLHRLRDLRRHHTDLRIRRIPARARVERSAKTLNLLRDLRCVSALRSFR